MIEKKSPLFFFIITLIFSSCGIDNIVYLEPPKLIHSPSGHSDESQMYFEFETSDKENLDNALGFFKGFEVYYRIYESESECKNLIENMINYNTSNPSNSVNYLLSSYNFKLLTHQGHSYNDRPLVPALPAAPPNHQLVEFRLEPAVSYSDDFRIDGTVKGKVLRQTGEKFTSAKQGDYDVQSSSNPSPDSFYVAVFAAAYGFDNSFKTTYSAILSLGYVKIKKNP
ncbi:MULTISPECIES: hypothetical protein [unclassified Treponema]|uniref:hypothetical protein n=1 Tax=unclassified Treponema TaxID=2638727 RepID=UPI0020A2DF73|nr:MULTISPECIES: hypothetical protein [unclassified Treponema]UTC67701.1 hypothetical protein E4O06_03230 [Treponema sp. OMZ 789]UTC70429.1 hypothetical protein E4O01_03220 [Treponema sp. OMZ 790]UTC73142.1 hypothetical protein E4O02_03220 [Treponema sp. OMZ 791]